MSHAWNACGFHDPRGFKSRTGYKDLQPKGWRIFHIRGNVFFLRHLFWRQYGLRVKMCVWLGVSRGLDLAFLNAD